MATPTFPPKTIELLKKLGLKESDILDVFHSGEYQKTKTGGHSMVKYYSSYGYEIGLIYGINNTTGGYVITFVWKRERR